jgi:antitoxin component YwqK of YwqJK toxin-antitoxin module
MEKMKSGLGVGLWFFLLLGPSLAGTAGEILMKDGRVYKNYTRLQDMDSYFLFYIDGKNYSINKYKVDKITDDQGAVVFQLVDLTMKRVRNEEGANDFVFFQNDKECGTGHWNEDGEFVIDSGRIPDGLYKEYYDSGELFREAQFRNGNFNGDCKIYFKSGKPEREGTLKNGREEGNSKYYYNNGALKGESVFVDGKKHGPTILYYLSGGVKARMNFDKGNAQGVQKMYYENGALESEMVFEQGVRQGLIKYYYESGKLKMEGKFLNGKLDGLARTYYESGRIKKEKNFVEDRILK